MWQHEDRLMELRYFACMSGCCTMALKNEVRVAPTKRPVGDVMDELSNQLYTERTIFTASAPN
jgi:hypothetical protein